MAGTTIPQLETFPRPGIGSRSAHQLRQQGLIPVVIYGHKQDPAHVAVNRKALTELLHHNAHLVDVTVDGNTEHCLVKDIQWNNIGTEIIHLDLTRVDLNERVTVEVPLHFVGEAPGLKTAGAYLEHPLSDLEIECLATSIPDAINIDVSGLQVGEPISVADLKLPEGVTAVTDADTIVAVIHVTTAEEVEVTPAEEVVGEPEVIGGKKEDDEAEEK
jgi:large subunit ribosomal protein L25